MRAPWVLALVSASWLSGETEPKEKATDYPAHATAGNVSIGAEYLVHSIPAGNQTFVAADYLVVEVAVFPAKDEPAAIRGSSFTLRLNGKKLTLPPVAPGFVAASLKYPDWELHPRAEASAGVGDAGVILGRPPAVGRFPGDPTTSRLPRAPQAPPPDDRRGIEREEPERAEDVIAKTALPDGLVTKPVSGFVYFPYKGKAKALKSVELIYDGKAGTATLKLM
jgi:hypothetical protein